MEVFIMQPGYTLRILVEDWHSRLQQCIPPDPDPVQIPRSESVILRRI